MEWGVREKFAGALSIFLVFSVVVAALITLRLHPINDTINWLPFFDYFFSTLAQGSLPLWNPYSQLGTPFFPVFQALGLLDPTNLAMVALYKMEVLSTVDANLVRMFLRFFLFVVGAYLTIGHVTRSARVALVFSLVLMFGMLPTFFRQHGVIDNHFLLPLITAFTLEFFSARDGRGKGLLLVAIAYMLGVSLNVYIPAGVLTHFALMAVLYLLLFEKSLGETVSFAASRLGRRWLGAAVLVGGLLSVPVIELYLETHDGFEMFGSLRMYLSNHGHLIPFFASDLPQHSVFFSGNVIKPSLSLFNLLGFFIEPFTTYLEISGIKATDNWLALGRLSEIRLYLGLAPLLCLIPACKEWRQPMVRMFLVLALVMLAVSCNFLTANHEIDGVRGMQRAILFVFPWFAPMEPLQNLGGILFFDLTILAALGWSRIGESERDAILTVGSVMLLLKLLFFSDYAPWGWILAAALVSAWMVVRARLPIKATFAALCVLVLVDMGSFFYPLAATNLEGTLYGNLEGVGAVSTQREVTFTEYREIAPQGPYLWNPSRWRSVSAPELVMRRKWALGPPVLKMLGVNRQLFDQFFSSRSYYDYLANVSLDRQLAVSGVMHPLLAFFPDEGVVPVKSKYEAVEKINGADPDALGGMVVIESGPGESRPIEDVSPFFVFAPPFALRPGAGEMDRLKSLVDRHGSPLGTQISVVGYGVNRLELRIKAPSAGVVYWADGYSKHWRATVNGVPKPIEKANVNFKAVRVDAGDSRVEFTFDPRAFRTAVYLYFLGSGLFLLILAWAGVKRCRR